MGGNVELDIFLKKEALSLNQIFFVLEMGELYVSVKEMSVFDDWKYTNETNIDLASFSADASDIFLKKFTRIYFIVNNMWRCVLLTSFEDTYINLSFGLNSDDFIQSAENDSNCSITLLYNRATDIINDAVSKELLKERFLVASMGKEYSVQFDDSLITMLNDNSGAERWIVPKEPGKNIFLKKFVKEEKSATTIFSFARFYAQGMR